MIISDYAHWITKANWFDTALRMALVPVTGTLTRARPQYASFRTHWLCEHPAQA